jgi:hypothetical protein
LVPPSLRLTHVSGGNQPKDCHGWIPHLLDNLRIWQLANQTQEIAARERLTIDGIEVASPKDKSVGIIEDRLLDLPYFQAVLGLQFLADTSRDPKIGFPTVWSPHRCS